MDKIEKIRNELERRIALYSGWSNETVHPTRIDEDKQLLSFLDTLGEEPDKSLEKAALRYAIPAYMKDVDENYLHEYPRDPIAEKAFIAGAEWQEKRNEETIKTAEDHAFLAGADWQKEQFEKNRLAHCDALSKEDYDRETDFAMEIIEKEHRQPTFLDAINYGMRLQKDALLEWLDGKMTIEGATWGFNGGYDAALEDVIEHINKM